jgi:hypothetical protein
MSLVPANDIYPALPEGVTPSTALNSYQLTLSREEQNIFNFVSTQTAVTGSPPPFLSQQDYLKFKMATYANKSDPTKQNGTGNA